VALILVLLIPLIAFAILAATFSAAVIRELKIDIVDQDNSATSMAFVETVAASPSLLVAARSTDLTGAMTSIRSGKAIAALYLPQDFERDILAGKRPQAVIFANKQFLTPGNVAATGLQAALSTAFANLPKASAVSASGAPGALVVEQFVLSNPGLNYAQFLLRAILPTILHVLIAVAAGYAVGSEFGQRDMRSWLAAAGGSPLNALVGKLLPYAAIFLGLMMVGLVVINGLFGIPFRGDPVMVAAAGCLLITAYLALGALLQLAVRNLPFGLVLTGILCSPAFGFAGVGYPILAMNSFSEVWGAILPLRWYIEILFDQAARGVPVQASASAFMVLALLAALYAGLAWFLLHVVARHPPRIIAEPQLARGMARTGLVRGFRGELLRVTRDRGVFGLVILGPIIYGFLYPQPYATQLIRDLPVAVVDQDGSELGRNIAQALDAHEGIAVTVRSATLAEAEAAMTRGEVYGIVDIPSGAQRDLLRGQRVAIPTYIDSAYLLVFSRVTQSVLEAVGSVSAEIGARGARPDGSLYRLALATNAPVEIIVQPLFNPTGGYGSYAVPAAFILILQQTLLMGAATLGGLAFLTGGVASRAARLQPGAVLGQALAHVLLVLPGLALYLIVLPRFYGFSQQGRMLDLLAFALPFILSVSFLGQFVGGWFRRRETSVLLLIAVSLPLFFLVGVAWPPEAIPEALRKASLAFPSTTAIDGFVRLNQMGASFADVFRDWLVLWLLAALYAAAAMLSPLLMREKAFAHAS
jgi:ABC-2 type transport system permease protein